MERGRELQLLIREINDNLFQGAQIQTEFILKFNIHQCHVIKVYASSLFLFTCS